MTNREWLNTLSDEEYAEEWLKIEKMLHGDCGFHIEVIMDWLSQPHEQTADEDFAEIGFQIESTSNVEIVYGNKHRGTKIIIGMTKNYYDTDGDCWEDEQIDHARTIADKKRKEVWGNIHDKEVE